MDVNQKKDKEQARAIRGKMKREGNAKIWYFINQSQQDPKCGAFHVVQKMEDDTVIESTNQEET